MRNYSSRMDIRCPLSRVHWNDCGESFDKRHISLKKRDRVRFAPVRHQAPRLPLLNFHEERICAGTPKTLKDLKKHQCRRIRSLFHKCPKRPLQTPKTVCLPEVVRRKRAKTGSFTLKTADRQPRLGMTDDIVNQCYAVSLIIK